MSEQQGHNDDLHFVYVISALENSVPVAPCKIGITKSPASRLAGIQTGNPRKLELMSAIPIPGRMVAKWLEEALHDQFEDFRLVGEWFDVCPVDAAIGVCTIAREMFLAICKDAPETAERIVDNLGIAKHIRQCFDFIAYCDKRGLPLDTKFAPRVSPEQTAIH
ncbi:GIY-YIG nuclease family protein [Bradyrhizobium phage ppBeUSDA76-2]|uniref:GIY-YIG nuclease family protein n=1 Tax=Bradyrhizobium TaxID=374 RepID=UPI00037C0166|nr:MULTISPECIES: GIY-YIG nuclease family protein [Bradyrhizobium]WAX24404.1 GIY-YIG nuclease family protein [Bradyrhizobium phage ppBeUSDA76-2]MCP1732440.1 hypothetical protein [Bradyrhizobium elkanii]MCS3567778.1 hypothetical protein [Bradyrhizobium elkanii]MCS3590739.1 hypothetical protein [Bradyrhizobium elkanii]MCS3620182.1 hypothetical protein [Bradyrhizobium elkanii]